MAITHRCFIDWFGPELAASREPLPALKQHLAARGVNARGWRLYLDYGDALFEPLARPWFTRGSPNDHVMHAADYLKLLQACEMDVPPPLVLAHSLQEWAIPDELLRVVPPLFLRAAWKAVAQAEYAGDAAEDFIEREVVPVAHWFFQSGAWREMDTGQLKAGWGSLLRRRTAWLEQRRRRGIGDWVLPVRSVEWDAYRFVGLATVADLEEEGSAMRHCVGTYGDSCRKGELLIYSVRYRQTELRRVATLSVRMVEDGRWEVDQLKAWGNADPDTRVWRAVPALLTSLEQACRMSPAEWLSRFRDQAMAETFDHDDCDLPF